MLSYDGVMPWNHVRSILGDVKPDTFLSPTPVPPEFFGVGGLRIPRSHHDCPWMFAKFVSLEKGPTGTVQPAGKPYEVWILKVEYVPLPYDVREHLKP
jgi:hypothetical protein